MPGIRVISPQETETLADRLCEKMPRGVFEAVCPIPRGGRPPAEMLRRRMPEIRRVVAPEALDDPALSPETVLIVDDVVDTGRTISGLKGCRVACLVKKPWADPPPDFFALETEDWVVFPWQEEAEERENCVSHYQSRGLPCPYKPESRVAPPPPVLPAG